VRGSTADIKRVAITLTAEEKTTEITDPALLKHIVPLVAARKFAKPDPLATYGLDDPRAIFTFDVAGRVTSVFVGAANFDHTGYYVRRADDRVVFLVLAADLDPVFASVGLAPSTSEPK
jgi:hypothetical protein